MQRWGEGLLKVRSLRLPLMLMQTDSINSSVPQITDAKLLSGVTEIVLLLPMRLYCCVA